MENGQRTADGVGLKPRVFAWLGAKGEGRLTRFKDILFNPMEAERRTGR